MNNSMIKFYYLDDLEAILESTETAIYVDDPLAVLECQ